MVKRKHPKTNEKPQVIQLKYGQRDWIDIFTKEDTKMANRCNKKLPNITNHQGNSNPNCNEISLIPVRMAVIKKITAGLKTKYKREPLCIIGISGNWCGYCGNRYVESSKNFKK